jgi:hypothetical protein
LLSTVRYPVSETEFNPVDGTPPGIEKILKSEAMLLTEIKHPKITMRSNKIIRKFSRSFVSVINK